MSEQGIDPGDEGATLFGDPDEFLWWKRHWQGMPEYEMSDLRPFKSMIVHFRNAEDRDAFAKLVEQTFTPDTKSIWYPKLEHEHFVDKRYAVPSTSPESPAGVIAAIENDDEDGWS